MKQSILSNVSFPVTMNINEPFPYYLNDDRKNIGFALVVSVFVVVFMVLYRPYYSSDKPTMSHVYTVAGITFFVLSTAIVLLPKLFPVVFEPTTWTLKKYLIHTFLKCVAIGLICVAVNKTFFYPDLALAEISIRVFTKTALIGIIPVSLFTLFLKNRVLQENLDQVIKANQELEKIRNLKNENSKAELTEITLRSDTSETLTFRLPDLLFIRADDNYSTVYWVEDKVIQKKLLRANLKNIETQINNPFTIRCHRSYMVNVHAISNVTGNTNGYKLLIKDSDHAIPVARPKGKEVMEKIGQLKNMMELY